MIRPVDLVAKPHDLLPEDVLQFDSYVHRGALTKAVLSPDISRTQFAVVEARHGISRSRQEFAYELLRQSTGIETDGGKPVITPAVLTKVFQLPSATGFWDLLRSHGCFKKEQTCIVVKEEDSPKLGRLLEDLEPCEIIVTPTLIQLSGNSLSDKMIYKIKRKSQLLEKDELSKLLYAAMEAELASVESLAEIDVKALNAVSALPRFDYLIEEHLVDALAVDEKTARWIIEQLVKENILRVILEIFMEPSIFSPKRPLSKLES